MTDTQPQSEPIAASALRACTPLVACCLLDGGVRASQLVKESGRSVLDLDIGPDRTLLDVWIDSLTGLSWGVDRPLLRVLHGGTTPAPAARPSAALALDIRSDSDSYRGPAGVVRDGMCDQDPAGAFLVCEAGRYTVFGLRELVAHHQRQGADVTIARDASGAPAGVLVIACRMLEVVAEKGFVDLKEQWLGKLLKRGNRVLVHDLPQGATMPVRTRLDLLQAARIEAGAAHDGADPAACGAAARLARRLTPGWAISRRAVVGPGAVVARSIVMERAQIGDDAVVSSSVILPGAVVPPGSLVVDRVVA